MEGKNERGIKGCTRWNVGFKTQDRFPEAKPELVAAGMTTRGRRDRSHDVGGVVARWAARNTAGAGGGSGSRDAPAREGSKESTPVEEGEQGIQDERENRTKEVGADNAEGSY